MKQTDSPSVADLFQRLSSFYYLLVGLPLLVFSWVYLNLNFWEPWYFFENSAMGTVSHIVLVGIAVLVAIAANIQYRRFFRQLEPVPPGLEGDRALEWKMKMFSKASLQQCLLLTASTILVIIGFYLSLEQFYVPLYAALLVLFSMNRPSPERIADDMRMKKEERLVLKEELKQRE